MKKAHFLFLIFPLVVFLFIAFLYSRQMKLSCDSLEEIYLKNQDIFEKAASELLAVPASKGLWINKQCHIDEDWYVVQIDQLHFVSTEDYLDEAVCENLYKTVEPLFSKVKIDGIAYGPNQIQFCIKLDMGYESSIIYTYSGKEPAASFVIFEKRKINDNWYAVVAHD